MDDLISKLSEIRSQYNCFDEAERQYYHALSEAIRELSGRVDGDTIYRQAAYDALMAEPLKWDDSSVWESARCHQWMMDMDVIKELPSAQPKIKCIANITMTDEQVQEAFEKVKADILSAQPERNRGRWNEYYRMHSGDTFACNRCGSCFVVLQGADKMNFCPNCGARMVQEGEDNDS